MGVTGTPGANVLAREADLILGIGTRYRDFTTASKTAFQNPAVRFININVAECDAYKHAALPVVADAREALRELGQALESFRRQDRTSVVVVETDIHERVPGYESWWDVRVAEVSKFEEVRAARKSFEAGRKKERYFF